MGGDRAIGGRPRGEIREALHDAVDRLHAERGCFHYRDAAALAQVGYEAARYGVKRIVEAGELIVIGSTRVPGVSKPLNLYTRPTTQAQDGAAALHQAVMSWADFR